MHREDFIKKAVRQFAQFLYKIFGLVDVHRHDEALAEIDRAREELLGLDATLVHGLSERDIVDLLTTGDEIQGEKLLILAELFSVEGDIYAERGNTEKGSALHLKALNLMLEVSTLTGVLEFPKEFMSIEEIDDKIEDELPQETQANLFFYYDDAGKYGFAVETLLEFVETYPEEETMIGEGLSFLENLSRMDDEALSAAGLEREDLRKGIAELERMGRTHAGDGR